MTGQKFIVRLGDYFAGQCGFVWDVEGNGWNAVVVFRGESAEGEITYHRVPARDLARLHRIRPNDSGRLMPWLDLEPSVLRGGRS